jgi:hypothetical protein
MEHCNNLSYCHYHVANNNTTTATIFTFALGNRCSNCSFLFRRHRYANISFSNTEHKHINYETSDNDDAHFLLSAISDANAVHCLDHDTVAKTDAHERHYCSTNTIAAFADSCANSCSDSSSDSCSDSKADCIPNTTTHNDCATADATTANNDDSNRNYADDRPDGHHQRADCPDDVGAQHSRAVHACATPTSRAVHCVATPTSS